MLEKYISHLIGYCVKNKIGTIVIGDVKGIREKANYSKVVNQKIHQWLFKRINNIIQRKANFAGISVLFVKENWTSQECPICSSKNKMSNRNYSCPGCGFKYHRDGVGAINIYKRYTGEYLVVEPSD